MVQTVKPLRDKLELCAVAGQMLKDAGFIVAITSFKTVSVYYRWPDRPHLLRVSDHRKGKNVDGLRGPIASRITFNGTCGDAAGMMKIGDDQIRNVVALAIGNYFLRSGPAS